MVAVAWLLLLISGLGDLSKWHKAFGLRLGNVPANWFPIPFLPAALAFVLAQKRRWSERRAWLAGGVVFALVALPIWGHSPLALALIALCPLLLLAGARIGVWVYATLSQPRRANVWAIALVGTATPFVVGMVDLYLRAHTP